MRLGSSLLVAAAGDVPPLPGLHAPQEATRILGEAIDLFRKGQVSLRPLERARKPGPRAASD